MLAHIHEGSGYTSSFTEPQNGQLIASGQVARESGGFGIEYGRCVTVVLLATLPTSISILRSRATRLQAADHG
jgi:hypothetical protein